MSWNAGGGARLLPTVLQEKGHHVFAIQEAHVEQMMQLEAHNWVLAQIQCVGIRTPAGEVDTIARDSTNKISWHVAEVLF